MNLYKVLELSKDATQDDIKNAYRKLAKKYHPDTGGDEVLFKKINDAYSTLSNKEKKEEYDRTINNKNVKIEDDIYDINNSSNNIYYDFVRHAKQDYQRKARENQEKEKVINTDLTLDEFINGTSKQFKFKDNNIDKTLNVNFSPLTLIVRSNIPIDNKKVPIRIVGSVKPIENKNESYIIYADNNKGLLLNIDYSKCKETITLDLDFMDQKITLKRPKTINTPYMIIHGKVKISINFI